MQSSTGAGKEFAALKVRLTIPAPSFDNLILIV